jgi:predicted enzyme related to lactoylglutathione lyase
VEAPVLELRVALTAQDYQRIFNFYHEGLRLDPAELWTDSGNAALFEMGRATLEIFDEEHASTVDQIETEKRTSGQIRFALRVPDVDAAVERLLAKGATLVHKAVVTPWGDYNARLQSPDGLQVTLFQISENR